MEQELYQERYRLADADCDCHLQLTWPRLQQLAQIVEGRHSARQTVQSPAWREGQHVWMLAETQMRAYQPAARSGQILTFGTDIIGRKGARLFRRVRVWDESETLLQELRSAWFVVELDSRKVCRLDGLIPDLERYPQGRMLWPATDFAPQDSEELTTDLDARTLAFTVPYSDIDANQHMNNVAYLRRSLDFWLAVEGIEAFTLTAWQQQFKHELYRGEAVELWLEQAERAASGECWARLSCRREGAEEAAYSLAICGKIRGARALEEAADV